MDTTIFCAHQDLSFATDLEKRIKTDQNQTYLLEMKNDDLRLYQAQNREAFHADVVIFIISPHTDDKNAIGKNSYRNVEISALLDVLLENGSPQIIPLILGKNTNIPKILLEHKRIVVPFPDDDTIRQNGKEDGDRTGKENAIQSIRTILASKNEIKESEKRKQEKAKQNVAESLSKNITGMLELLEKDERKNARIAYALYAITAVVLLAPFPVIAVFFHTVDISAPKLESFAVSGVICLIILAVIVAVAKLFYSLAKSFMVESLRCADRVHAIKFGLFFFDAYGSKLTHAEIMSAFGSWNIDNGGYVFKNLTADDIDPKVLDTISSIAGMIKK